MQPNMYLYLSLPQQQESWKSISGVPGKIQDGGGCWLATCLVNGLYMHEGYQRNGASLCLPNG